MQTVIQTEGKTYVDFITRIYPWYAFRWGIERTCFAADNETITTETAVLRALIARIMNSPERESPDARMLRSSVEELLFEQEVLLRGQLCPYYYVEERAIGVIYAFLILFRSSPPAEFPMNTLFNLIDNLLTVLAVAQQNLDFQALPRFDALHSLQQLKLFVKEFTEHIAPALALPVKRVADVRQSCQSLIDRFEQVPRGNDQVRVLAPNILAEWFYRHSQIVTNWTDLTAWCTGFLDKHTADLQALVVKDGAPIPVTEARLSEVCHQNYQRLNPIFGRDDAYLEELPNFVPSETIARAGYLFTHYLTDHPRQEVQFNPQGYIHEIDLSIDMVHETFPGHHWERSHYLQCYHGQWGSLTYGNHAFLEGWPRYCEAVFARCCGDANVERRVNGRLAKSALQTLAVSEIYRSGSIQSTVQKLMKLSKLPLALIQPLVMRAYFVPKEAACPLIGYLALEKYVGQQSNKLEAHQQIVSTGSMLLWGITI